MPSPPLPTAHRTVPGIAQAAARAERGTTPSPPESAYGCLSAQRPERRAHFGGEQIRFLPSGEVTALVHLVEVDDVGVRLLDPAARGTPDLPGERREADRNRDRRWSLAVLTSIFLSFFPVRACSRRPGACQPIQRDVVDDVVPREIARGLSVDKTAGNLLVAVRIVIDHPCRQRDG